MPKASSANRQHWKLLIQEQESSGLSVPKFCAQQGLKAHQLNYYKAIFSQPKKSAFSELEPNADLSLTQESRVTIQYNDLFVIFEGGYDLQQVATLCNLLDSAR